MSKFKYSEQELEINKVLKYNQDVSLDLLSDPNITSVRKTADTSIAAAEELLASLGYGSQVADAKQIAKEKASRTGLTHKPKMETWEEILGEADQHIEGNVSLEDILTESEINAVSKELDQIYSEFSYKTSIVNKTDLAFLAIATALQVSKSLLVPYVADKFGYGDSFDPAERLNHNDRSIENAHRQANDRFKNDHIKNHAKGYWINILYQTPPYDITKGSKELGINMGGAYHRMYTLGHDPVLGWLFGTLNILTDIITLNDFRSFRVERKPSMIITPQRVDLITMIAEGYEMVNADFLNLPAAIFAQAQHLKSDEYTKVGLPVPLLAAFNENLASSLYKNQYDALCCARDIKIVGVSYVVSLVVDIMIGLVHGLFRSEHDSPELYEVRTRKILLISNLIASSSTIINSYLTQNPKNLDIGSLLSSVAHLFTDVRFFAKIKKEYIEKEIQEQFQKEFDEIDAMYNSL